jgi:LPS sulfotransferase NodH
MQATWGEIERLSEVDFFEFFECAHYVWLRRRDIVNQAISLLVATETGTFHRRTSAEHAGDTAHMILERLSEDEVASKLINWIAHIVSYEAMTEIQLVTRNISPYRLYYEDFEKSSDFHVAAIKQLCGIEDERRMQVDGVQKNIQDGRSGLRDIFIRNNRGALKALEAIRPPMIY